MGCWRGLQLKQNVPMSGIRSRGASHVPPLSLLRRKRSWFRFESRLNGTCTKPVFDGVMPVPWMMLPSDCTGPQVRPRSSDRLMPPGLPSHDTNTVPSSVPPAAHGLSGALWIVAMADQVTPRSEEVIMRMLPAEPSDFVYSWQTAYMVPPPSMATAGSPTNTPVMLGVETFLLHVSPPSVENE